MSTAVRRSALPFARSRVAPDPSGWWLVGSLIVLSFALRALVVGMPLGVDEGGLAFVSHAWGPGSSLYGPYWIDRPPLLLGLFKVAGLGGAVGIRVLGAMAAAALVAIAYPLGRRVAGETAGRAAAILTALMASSVALRTFTTPAELLASVPAAGSVACLLSSRERGAGWLFAAGALASAALMVKQSFFDAGVAGAVFLAATAVTQRRLRPARLLAYAAGAAVPLLVVLAWLTATHHHVSQLAYALFGFRINALHTLAVGSVIPLRVRFERLFAPALGAGIVVALATLPFGLATLRRDRVLVLTLGAWVAAGVAGILAGGSYWPHYLIQLVVPMALLTAVAVASWPSPVRWGVVGVVVAMIAVVDAQGVARLTASPPDEATVAAGRYVRAHAAPGDTQYVMYSRANADYYTGLPSPFPYAWSLIMRAVPGAPQRLARLLASPRRPTWIIGWQRPDAWRLDPHHTLAAELADHYRVAKVVAGHPIYHVQAL